MACSCQFRPRIGRGPSARATRGGVALMFCMDRMGYAYAALRVQFPFLLGIECGVILGVALVYLFFTVAKGKRS